MCSQVCDYSVKAVTEIAKLALEHHKAQDISRLASGMERFALVTESIQLFCNLMRSDVESVMHMYSKSAFENLNFAQNTIIWGNGKNRNLDMNMKDERDRYIIRYNNTFKSLGGFMFNKELFGQRIEQVCELSLRSDFDELKK